MIGFLFVVIGILCFMGIGYTLLLTNFITFMNTMILSTLISIALVVLFGVLWEFYFPQPAKMFIANKRVAAYELLVDDVGWGELIPSKKYMPQGLIIWRHAWCLLPRPIMKLEDKFRAVVKKRGRPIKDAEKAKEAQEQWDARQKQIQGIELKEAELAEKIGLKKVMLKGTGRPLWLQYQGLAANFNPYVLVPSELQEKPSQDNPYEYFDQLRDYLNASTNLTAQARAEIIEKLKELENHIDHVRVVLDPRRFKEIHPKMYTQSQVDDHGRIHFELGRLSVTGIPMKYILIIILVVVAIAGIAGVYFLFGPKQTPQQPAPTQQASTIIHYLLNRGFKK